MGKSVRRRKPKAPTPKQRKFAHAYVEGMRAPEAYRLAYNAKNMKPKTVQKRAYELLRDGVVAGYIRQLQKEHRQRHDIDVDALTDELEEARFSAMVFGHISAAVAATMGKAKLHGLITDHIKVNGLEALKKKTDAELVEAIRELAGEIAGHAAAAKRGGSKPRAT